MPIALDATYSLGRNPSGVAVYSQEILRGLARAHPEERFLWYFRPNRFLRSFQTALPRNASRRILLRNPPAPGGALAIKPPRPELREFLTASKSESGLSGLRGAPETPVFHALNQRVDASGANRRTVATFHDLFVMTSEYSSKEFRERFSEQAQRAAERSDLIIAVSHFTARQVEELLGVESSRIRVIPHGTRAPLHISPAREDLVLMVGAVQKRKNVARLVKAFEQMPVGWKLALAGSAQGYGAAEELRAVEESPRRRDIDVLGYVPEAALEDLYGRARMLAFPSLDEGFGMPVLDAMARGVPVVSSRRSAIPEVAGDAALLVDPEDTEELASALNRLAGDEALRQDLARKGRERAAEFTWGSAVERTWGVYQELR